MSDQSENHELESVKRLMILQLLQSGVKQTHIAAMLGVSDATMSRMIPKGLAAAIKKEI
ncbi:MAG: hypothetical protein ACTS1X_04050 [Parasphingopyxis sp.]|uniref:hypothetical protein n=1 Tax=Parasphingopyxis sp. TaxID=1920299 RepID=UPI003F9F92FC